MENNKIHYMESKISFSIFSQEEDLTYSKFQGVRDRFFAPVCGVLTKVGVKPDHLSFLNLLLLVPFVFFAGLYPLISVVMLLVSLVLDSIDGCLARYQKINSAKGALLDIAVDHAFLFGVVLTLIYSQTVSGFWGAAYGLNYLLLVGLILAMRALKLQVFPVVRSKYYLYAFWIFFVFTGVNYLDIFLVFFTIYMFLTNLFLFYKLRCSLSS